MKKFLLATVASAALVSSASAADLAARPYTKAPAVVAAAYNWSGFYVGVMGGYGWSDQVKVAGVDVTDADIKGGFAGGTVGFNYQAPGSQFVFGVEADAAWADLSHSESIGLATAKQRIDSFARSPVASASRSTPAASPGRLPGRTSSPDRAWRNALGCVTAAGPLAPEWACRSVVGQGRIHVRADSENYFGSIACRLRHGRSTVKPASLRLGERWSRSSDHRYNEESSLAPGLLPCATDTCSSGQAPKTQALSILWSQFCGVILRTGEHSAWHIGRKRLWYDGHRQGGNDCRS
jgi:opacity protein-like surface antigen